MNPGKNLGKLQKNKFEEIKIIEEIPSTRLKNIEPEEVEAVTETPTQKLKETQDHLIQGLQESKKNPETEEFLSQERWDKPSKPVFVPRNHPLIPILSYARQAYSVNDPEKSPRAFGLI